MTTKTYVKYNSQSRSWQAINGKTLDCGPGKQGKRQALLTALAHDHPALSEIVSAVAAMNGNDPKLLDRLLRGAQLLVKGHIFQGNAESRYKVKSQSNGAVYLVEFSGIPAAYSCDCQDYESGLQRLAGVARYGGADVDFNPMPVCKHILAAHLAWLSQWPLQDEPIPFTGEATY